MAKSSRTTSGALVPLSFTKLALPKQARGVSLSNKLYFRNTQANGIGANYYDLLSVAGTSTDTAVVNTTASGSAIPFTKTAGGASIKWVTGRADVGGFTITSHDISLWGLESALTVNAGFSYRLFKRDTGGTETALGSAIPAGVELTTANVNYYWFGGSVSYSLLEDERLGLEVLADNVGTMAVGTATLTFNGGQTNAGGFVSSNSAVDVTSTNTIAVTKTVSADSTLVFSAQWNGGNTPTSVSDGTNAFSLILGSLVSSNGQTSASYMLDKGAVTAGSKTVTLTLPAATPFKWGYLLEVSGRSANALFGSLTNPQITPGTGSNALTSGTLNGVPAGCTLVGITFDTDSTTTYTAGTGYTYDRDIDPTNSGGGSEYQNNVSAGNYAATFTQAANNSAITHIIALKPLENTASSYLNVYPAVTFKAETGNVSLTLTGQAVGVATGALTYAFDKALSGQAVSAATGTIVYQFSKTLTGQAVTGATGTVTYAFDKTLAGQPVGANTGTIVYAFDKTLTGQDVAASTGAITFSGNSDFIGTLTGQAVSANTGSLVYALDKALSGQAVNAATGTAVYAFDKGLTGQAVVSATGAISYAFSKSLTGQPVTANQGALTYAFDKTLSGQAVTAATGTVTHSSAGIDFTGTLTGIQVSVRTGTITVPNLAAGKARRHKYIVEKNGTLVIYNNKQDAINALNKAVKADLIKAPNADVSTSIKNEPQALKQPILYDINAMLQELKDNSLAQALINQKNYEQFIKAYEKWVDEEEIELLLLAS